MRDYTGGRTAEDVCRDAADYFDLIDKLFDMAVIEDGKHAGKTLGDLLGGTQVQDDLRKVASEIENLRSRIQAHTGQADTASGAGWQGRPVGRIKKEGTSNA